MRWLLLDLARGIDRAAEPVQNQPRANDPGANSSDTSLSTTLTALYANRALPEKEREVVDLLYFHGLTQIETATLLGIAERTVRRHWTIAKVKLFEGLQSLVLNTGPLGV